MICALSWFERKRLAFDGRGIPMVVARADLETRLKMCRMRHGLPTTTRFVVLWQNTVNETMVKHARNKKRRAGRMGKVKLKVSHVKSACLVIWVVAFGLGQRVKSLLHLLLPAVVCIPTDQHSTTSSTAEPVLTLPSTL